MKKELPPLSEITIEDIKEGMVATYSQTITDADIKEFAGLSGDKNPVHVDQVYARQSPFKKRIAHGMLTASFFSGLFGTKLPGPGCVYTFQSLRFRKPVYVDDTVVAEVMVREVNYRKRTAKFSTTCKVSNEIVTEGEAEIYIPLYLTKILITKKNDLLEYKAAILSLFFDCFGKEMNDDFWDWAYQDNPNGDPIVSLYFDGDQLIGHYAVIPMLFELGDININGLLSMTTMVQKAYRKYGVFVEQASDVYEEGKRLGYKFVCGFPNKKSAPGFKRRLGWALEESLCVRTMSHDDLLRVEPSSGRPTIKFKMNGANFSWRIKKPGEEYVRVGDNLIKKYGEAYDLVYLGSKISMLNGADNYNVLVDCDCLEDCDSAYIFGYRIFDDSLVGVEFKKDLIISDIF